MKPSLALALLVATMPGWAQPAPSASAPPPAAVTGPDDTPLGGEPNVRHIVIEDKGSKIDELRVRGQTRRITVTPKVGTTKSYEIITGDATRDTATGTGGAKNAVGKRVWNVLAF